MIKLSVVTPCHNCAEYLPKCIEAVVGIKQVEGIGLEQVIVDDASTDESGQVLQKLSLKNSGILMFRWDNNKGQSAARNFGVSKISGEWLFFVDADDAVRAEGLVNLVTEVIGSGCEWGYGDFRAVDENGKHVPDHDYWGYQFGSTKECLQAMYKGEHFFQHSFVIKKSMFESLGGYNESLRMGEDFELCTRVLLAGYRLKYVPVNVYDHLIRSDSLSAGHRLDRSKHGGNVKDFYQMHKTELKKLGVLLGV